MCVQLQEDNRVLVEAYKGEGSSTKEVCGLLQGSNGSNSSIIEPRKCYRCNTLNEPNARICKHCGLILDARYAIQMHGEKEKANRLEEEVAKLTALVEEL
ncbi:MAG: hypothetical protein QW572_03570 [Candidatus Nitrosocaldus sp.]